MDENKLLEEMDKKCVFKIEGKEITIACGSREVAEAVKNKIEKDGLRIRAKEVRGPEPETPEPAESVKETPKQAESVKEPETPKQPDE